MLGLLGISISIGKQFADIISKYAVLEYNAPEPKRYEDIRLPESIRKKACKNGKEKASVAVNH